MPSVISENSHTARVTIYPTPVWNDAGDTEREFLSAVTTEPTMLGQSRDSRWTIKVEALSTPSQGLGNTRAQIDRSVAMAHIQSCRRK